MNHFKRLAFLCLCFVSFGFAQSTQGIVVSGSQTTSQTWFGLKTGYVNNVYPFGMSIHFGVDPVNISSPNFRISGNLRTRETGASFGIGIDAFGQLIDATPVNFYAGGGGAVQFENQSFLLDVHGLFGTEFRFIEYDLEELGLFLELSLGAALAIGSEIPQPNIPFAGLAFGFNFHF